MLRKNPLQIQVDAPSRMQFREALRLFLLDCKMRNLSPYTIQGYYSYLNGLYQDLLRWNLTLCTLQAADLQNRMIRDMQTRRLSPHTINGRIRACQQFFQFLYAEGILEEQLAIGLHALPAEKKPLRTFTPSELQLLLSLPNPDRFSGQRDVTIMLVLLDTGMRVNELAALKTTDIHWDEPSLLIQRAKNRQPRRLPFQQTCATALKNYLLRRGTPTCMDLWLTEQGTPFARSSIVKMISAYCKQAGLVGGSHLFRHTMAKWFLLNGGSAESLQYLLGHSSLEMTRYYVDLFPIDVHQQHKRYSPVEQLSKEFPEVHA